MSLIKSKELFHPGAFPLFVDSVVDRSLFQPDLHRHEYFEMLYVERGSLINRFKGEEQLLKAGDLVIMKPYVLHLLADGGGSNRVQAFCCSFLPQVVDAEIQSLEEVTSSQSPNRYFFHSFLRLAADDVSAVKLHVDSREQRADVVALLSRLREKTREDSDAAAAWSRCDFLRLLALMADAAPQAEADPVARSDAGFAIPASRYQAGLRKALNHIHDHYEEPLKLEDMAAMSGASTTYFCRLFKHETGMTFLGYVNGLRIERACVLLRDTCDNATDICYRVGFNDYSHFSRQFKKLTGRSVKKYRSGQPADE